MRTPLAIVEVGLRDGLQNEKTPVGTAAKVELYGALRAAGLTRFELTSFVNPRAVPQLADAAEVVAAATADPTRTELSALVINQSGYDRAKAAGAPGVAVVVVLTDELCRRNNRMTPAESLATARALVARAKRDGLTSRVYLAPAWVCPFAGAVPPRTVIHAVSTLSADPPDTLVLADTIGHAHPLEVWRLCHEVVGMLGAARVAAHFHDTQALGLANASAALAAGVRQLDASIGGLGGCPFAPGAAGNLATEDLVFLADKLGFDTGVDLDRLWDAVAVAGRAVGRNVGGRTQDYRQSRPQARAVVASTETAAATRVGPGADPLAPPETGQETSP
jgi:hydroxymethylglutaryl-CoA lyase